MSQATVQAPPVVSVVMPCFNGERWLGEAIDSALAQTYPAVETIVVDDGSTDRSLGVAQSFGDRIRLVRQERRGPCASRNRGVALATGEFLKFLDADDKLMPDCLERQVRSFGEFPGERVAIFGRVALVDEAGRYLLVRKVNADEGSVSLEWVIGNLIITSCPLFRTADIRKVGGIDDDALGGEEYDLAVRLAIDGVRFVFRDLIAYEYRQHRGANRITSQKAAPLYPAAIALTEGHLRLIEERQGKPLSLSLRAALAQRLWSLGRGAARNGVAGLAKSCFARAREICPEDPIPGTRRYKLASRLLSPLTVEWISWNLLHRRRAPVA